MAASVPIRFTVLALRSIDTVAQLFVADIFLDFRVSHASVAGMSAAELMADGYFRRLLDIRFLNLLPDAEVEEWIGNKALNEPAFHLRMRVSGRFAQLFELSEFPFDEQALSVRLTATQDTEQVEFVFNHDAPSLIVNDPHTIFTNAEWSLIPVPSIQFSVSDSTYSATGCAYPRAFITLTVRRRSQHYVTNIVLVLFVLVSISFAAFAVPVVDPSGRLQVIVTLLLAAISFKSSVAASIPKVSYHSLLDTYVVGCIVTVAVSALEAGVMAAYEVDSRYDHYFLIVLAVAWTLFNTAFVVRALDIQHTWRRRDRELQQRIVQSVSVNTGSSPKWLEGNASRRPSQSTFGKVLPVDNPLASTGPLPSLDSQVRRLGDGGSMGSARASPPSTTYIALGNGSRWTGQAGRGVIGGKRLSAFGGPHESFESGGGADHDGLFGPLADPAANGVEIVALHGSDSTHRLGTAIASDHDDGGDEAAPMSPIQVPGQVHSH